MSFDETLPQRTYPLLSAIISPAEFSTASQPRSLATTSDSAIIIAENSSIEVIKSNQRVFDITSPKFTPSSVAASGSTVAIGGEDTKVRLYQWDGKTLKQDGVLENNKGVVSALAFSPDGAWLAAGDVRIFLYRRCLGH